MGADKIAVPSPYGKGSDEVKEETFIAMTETTEEKKPTRLGVRSERGTEFSKITATAEVMRGSSIGNSSIPDELKQTTTYSKYSSLKPLPLQGTNTNVEQKKPTKCFTTFKRQQTRPKENNNDSRKVTVGEQDNS